MDFLTSFSVFALYLSDNNIVFLLFVFFLSLMVGSFLNVVIYRLPIILENEWKGDCIEFLSELSDKNADSTFTLHQVDDKNPETFNLSFPRSRCPACQHPISALENIPLISWIFLKGQCSACHSKISIRYPLIELSTALLSVLVAYTFGVQWYTLAALFLTWSMLAMAVIDFDTQLLPDNITLPMMWMGVLMSLLSISPITLKSSIIGLIIGYLILWSIYQLFKLITGKEGMGYGDFKLLALLGAWLGCQSLFAIILVSAVVGSIVGICLILFLGRDRSIPIPFGPYLAAAGFISLIQGEQINQILGLSPIFSLLCA